MMVRVIFAAVEKEKSLVPCFCLFGSLRRVKKQCFNQVKKGFGHLEKRPYSWFCAVNIGNSPSLVIRGIGIRGLKSMRFVCMRSWCAASRYALSLPLPYPP